MNQTTVTVGAGLLLCALSLIFLARRFDASDHGQAERLLGAFRTSTRAETFAAFLAERHGGDKGLWTTEIEDGLRGVVRVTWTGTRRLAPRYSWEIELTTQAIHPTRDSQVGKRLLDEFVNGPAPNTP